MNIQEKLRSALAENFPNCAPPRGEITPKYLWQLARYLEELDGFDQESDKNADIFIEGK